MKKSSIVIITGIIVFIIIFLIGLNLYEKDVEEVIEGETNSEDSQDNGCESCSDSEDYSEDKNEEDLLTEGGSGSSGNGETEDKIPEDVNQQPCGYYYSEYGVCNGTCSEGECVQEQRSCYCKK